jgi:hypothetical protein
VVLYDWPVFPPQLPAHEHCLQRHREDSRWIAFIDTDEFLFSPIGRPLPEVLKSYESRPGVVVNQAFFGTSGHRRKPAGLVIENYVESVANKYVKSVVDPTRVADCPSPHYFLYLDGSAVDENSYPSSGSRTVYVSFSRLKINHYNTKSEEEFRSKLATALPDFGAERPDSHFELVDFVTRFGRPDRAILEHLPALRSALEKAGAKKTGRR